MRRETTQKWSEMITDQAILSHIERQPHRSAGYKQLIREMSLRGSERQQLAERLQALVEQRPPGRNRPRPLHPGANTQPRI